MIKAIQPSEKVMTQPMKNFKSSSSKQQGVSIARKSQTEAAEIKYNVACLLAAAATCKEEKLMQQVANAAAQMNYCKSCN